MDGYYDILVATMMATMMASMIFMPLVKNSPHETLSTSDRPGELEAIGVGPVQAKIPSWLLPFGLAGVNVLSSGQIVGAFPAILGVLTGHAYHFTRHIFPNIKAGVGVD